jgi:translation elongation factor EF-1alpha
MKIKIGRISHYYDRIGVAVLSLTGKLQLGDMVHITGHSTDITQKVVSLEIEHQKVSAVGPGDEVALKVNQPAKKGDAIYKIIEE